MLENVLIACGLVLMTTASAMLGNQIFARIHNTPANRKKKNGSKQLGDDQQNDAQSINEQINATSQSDSQLFEEYWQAQTATLSREVETAIISDNSVVNHRESSQPNDTTPATLASNANNTNNVAPILLGEEAKRLAIAYLDFELQHGFIPRGKCSCARKEHLISARKELQLEQPYATLSHGGIAFKLGEKAIVLVEPLLVPIKHIERAIQGLEKCLAGKIAYIITAPTFNAQQDTLSHLAPLTKHFNIHKYTPIYLLKQ